MRRRLEERGHVRGHREDEGGHEGRVGLEGALARPEGEEGAQLG